MLGPVPRSLVQRIAPRRHQSVRRLGDARALTPLDAATSVAATIATTARPRMSAGTARTSHDGCSASDAAVGDACSSEPGASAAIASRDALSVAETAL